MYGFQILSVGDQTFFRFDDGLVNASKAVEVMLVEDDGEFIARVLFGDACTTSDYDLIEFDPRAEADEFDTMFVPLTDTRKVNPTPEETITVTRDGDTVSGLPPGSDIKSGLTSLSIIPPPSARIGSITISDMAEDQEEAHS